MTITESMRRARQRKLAPQKQRRRGRTLVLALAVLALIAVTPIYLATHQIAPSPPAAEPRPAAPEPERPRLRAAARPVVVGLPPKPPPPPPPPPPPKKKICYAVTVTEEPKPGATGFIDGAAVLKESLFEASARSKYGLPALVAFVSPRVSAGTRAALASIGFESRERPLPIDPARIEGDFLRDLWSKDSTKGGCCGAWELLKLYAWTLTEFHRVVHVDMDCLLLQPIDELFDLDVSLVYTADYNMMNDNQRRNRMTPAVQGGFLVVRPSAAVFDAIVAVSQAGRWGGKLGSGWEGTGVGHWWGGNTIQGVLPYFFKIHAPKHLDAAAFAAGDLDATEVDRCVYDNMVDKAVVDPDPPVGRSACRDVAVDDIKFMHFTVCQKPWSCHPNRDDANGLCPALHRIWFEKRRAYEAAHGMPSNDKPCQRKYDPMAFAF